MVLKLILCSIKRTRLCKSPSSASHLCSMGWMDLTLRSEKAQTATSQSKKREHRSKHPTTSCRIMSSKWIKILRLAAATWSTIDPSKTSKRKWPNWIICVAQRWAPAIRNRLILQVLARSKRFWIIIVRFQAASRSLKLSSPKSAEVSLCESYYNSEENEENEEIEENLK